MRTSTLAAVVALLLLPACNRAAQVADSVTESAAPATTPSTAAPSPAETAVASEDPTPTPPAAGQTVEVWYARDTPRGIFVEPETHQLDEPTPAVASAALTALLERPPVDPELSNLVPDGARLLDVDLDGETLIADFSLPGLNLGSAAETAMIQQIVHTATQFPTVQNVQILDEGEPLASGHVDLSEPVGREEFAMSPIIISSPAEGETVAGGDVDVEGTANVFEANLELQLLDPDDNVVEETFTTATCGTGCRGDWSHTFSDVTTAGTWTIVAIEPDASGGAEGAGPFVTRRTFTVR
jgi:spore germination protein GerM